MFEKLKNTIVPNGVTVEDHLRVKHPNGKWIIDNELIIYEAKVQHLTLLYKWKVTGDSLEAVSGKACELTPIYNVRLQEIENKKVLQNAEDIKIFDSVQEYEKIGIETKEAIAKVAKNTKFTEEEILNIYDKVSRAIYL